DANRNGGACALLLLPLYVLRPVLPLASVAVVVAIFGFIAIIGSDWEILKISVFFVFPLFVHGVSIVILQVTGRHERKFGSQAAE
ncbi:MAG: hypothetical protein AAFV59_18610, partial [Pseudomonadota bacterium]